MTDRICALELQDRDNLDRDMKKLLALAEKDLGFMPNVFKVYATDNDRLRSLMVPYLHLLRPGTKISLLEHEMMAVVCAATNGCYYCSVHHGAGLRDVSGDPVLAETLSRNYKLATLIPRHRAMLDFAVKTCVDAEDIGDDDRQVLRDVGFSDEDIWDIAATACFYAMTNRMMSAVGIMPNPEYLDLHRAPNKAQAAE